MDPAVAALAEAVAARNVAPLHEITPAAARERVRAGDQLCANGPALPLVEDVTIPADDAGAGIRARVYRRQLGADRRTLVYLHGGGWVTGDLEYADELCRFLAYDADCTVISVAYRLAPEHPYPQALNDARAALSWAAEGIASDGVLAVGGDSAGGNLAAACAIHARDNGGPSLAFQLLIYPVLDHDFTRPSYARNAAGFPFGADGMRWFWDHYAPDVSLRDHPSLSPLRAADLSGLPPAHIVVAGHDPLKDEGVAYAGRLREAGVAVSLREHPSLVHGFFRFTGAVAAAKTAVGDLTEAVTSHFDHRHRPGSSRWT
jgi:acetyl esterase